MSGDKRSVLPLREPKEKLGSDLVIVGNGRSLLGSGLGKKIDSIANILRFNPADELLSRDGSVSKYEKDVGKRMTIFCFNFRQATMYDVKEKLVNGFMDLHGSLRQVVASARDGYYMHSRRLKPWREINRILNLHVRSDNLNPRSAIGRHCSNAVKSFSYKVYGHQQAVDLVEKLDLGVDLEDCMGSLCLKQINKTSDAVQRNPGYHFTSGLNMICNFLEARSGAGWDAGTGKRGPKIYICGFDSFSKRSRVSYTGQSKTMHHFFDSDMIELNAGHDGCQHLRGHRMDIETKVIQKFIDKKLIEVLD
ncbi:hypothetical protein CL634_04975 [bacterium]|nr:hypothetical protein [bacterium]|tara:strand:+ start:190 stop:1110 length:921 start_codon:yes stop_codon:yes gene_type:complete